MCLCGVLSSRQLNAVQLGAKRQHPVPLYYYVICVICVGNGIMQVIERCRWLLCLCRYLLHLLLRAQRRASATSTGALHVFGTGTGLAPDRCDLGYIAWASTGRRVHGSGSGGRARQTATTAATALMAPAAHVF